MARFVTAGAIDLKLYVPLGKRLDNSSKVFRVTHRPNFDSWLGHALEGYNSA
jgi:hypothetical protein